MVATGPEPEPLVFHLGGGYLHPLDVAVLSAECDSPASQYWSEGKGTDRREDRRKQRRPAGEWDSRKGRNVKWNHTWRWRLEGRRHSARKRRDSEEGEGVERRGKGCEERERRKVKGKGARQGKGRGCNERRQVNWDRRGGQRGRGIGPEEG